MLGWWTNFHASMKEYFSAKSVPILCFNILAYRGDIHPQISSYMNILNSADTRNYLKSASGKVLSPSKGCLKLN